MGAVPAFDNISRHPLRLTDREDMTLPPQLFCGGVRRAAAGRRLGQGMETSETPRAPIGRVAASGSTMAAFGGRAI